MVPPARFELATLSLEVSCSIQLSYGGVVRDTRVELVSSVWKTDILTDIRIPRNRGDYIRTFTLEVALVKSPGLLLS